MIVLAAALIVVGVLLFGMSMLMGLETSWVWRLALAAAFVGIVMVGVNGR